jgi:hypothetical protein
MNLDEYFKTHDGTGILSTADGTGKVNGAVYAKPHILVNRRVAFIMSDRLSHHNLGTNPRAHYLFVENGGKSKGVRLHLDLVEESSDKAVIEKYSRRPRQGEDDEKRFLVTFEIVKARKLLGDEEITLA